ncbi:TolB family protein [Agromyces sp. M3QZ16-3]|uniref:TolB family protein n=1 Tax=Agromyces sp. M3QZ16-3 TaxID=3447585 RepID=UPI003F6901FB
MTTTTPLPSPPSTSSEPNDSELRTPTARAILDESAPRAPVEVLIEEARHRARRRRQVIGTVAIVAVAAAAIALTAALDGAGTPDDRSTALSGPVSETALGIFQPIRGRIVWAAGHELRAVDPADPTDIERVALPDDVDPKAMVSGWSADGTRLALTSEDAGKLYVLDARGRLTAAGSTQGCCTFVSAAWLSPDGRSAFEFVAPGRLQLREVSGLTEPRVIAVDPALGAAEGPSAPTHAWSPDGSSIAIVVADDVDTEPQPTSVHVVDLVTGVNRAVLGPELGLIRHLTWSPSGGQLLVVAGPWFEVTGKAMVNPHLGPLEMGLYLVDADPGPVGPAPAPEPIASGHFIAAAWSPDGERIAAIDHATPGVHSLVTMNRDGSGARRIVPDLGTRDWTGLAWHPTPSEPR